MRPQKTVVVLDQDQQYAQALAQYGQRQTAAYGWVWHVFDQPSLWHRWQQHNQHCDVVIYDSSWPQLKIELSNKHVIELHQDNKSLKVEQQTDKLWKAHKFIHLDEWMTQLIEVMNEARKYRKFHGILGFVGASGGIGTSTISLLFAQQAAAMGQMSLHLSLDPFLHTEWYTGAEDSTIKLEKLLYQLRYRKTKKLHEPWYSDLIQDNRQDQSLMMGGQSAAHVLTDCGEEELIYWLQLHREDTRWDWLVLDIPHWLAAQFKHAYSEMDAVVSVVADDGKASVRLDGLLDRIPELRGGLFILNKQMNRQNRDILNLTQDRVFYMPYISEWKKITSTEQWQAHPSLSRELRRLLRRISEQQEKAV